MSHAEWSTYAPNNEEDVVWVSDDGEVIVRTREEEVDRFVIPLERVPEYRKLVQDAARMQPVELR